MVYLIDTLPDLSMDRHAALHGTGVSDLAGCALAPALAALSPDSGSSIGLRYEVDPRRPRGWRLRILVRLPDGAEAGLENEGPALALARRFYPMKPVGEASLRLPDDATVVHLLRPEAALILPDEVGMTVHYATSVLDTEPGAWPPRRVLDPLFSTLTVPAGLDCVVRRASHTRELLEALAAEHRHVDGLASGRGIPSIAGGSLGEPDRLADPVARRIARMLEELGVHASGESLYRFSLRTWAVDPSLARSLALGVAGLLGGAGSWVLEEIRPGHGAHAAILAAASRLDPTEPPHTAGGLPCSSAFVAGEASSILLERDTPRLQRLARISQYRIQATASAAIELLRLPVSEGSPLETIPLESELWGGADDDGLFIGTDLDTGRPATIPRHLLPRHTSTFGCPGTGKTMTNLRLLHEYLRGGGSILVLESSKEEYRRLLRHPESGAVRVLTPGNDRLAPLRLNVLEVPPEITVAEHASAVADAITSTVDSGGPIGPLLRRTVLRAYSEQGLEPEMLGSECSTFPTLLDVERLLPAVMDEVGYSRETRADVEGALSVRLGSLLQVPHLRTFACQRSEPPLESFLEQPTILELQGLSSHARNLFTLLLLVCLQGVIRGRGPRKDPELLIVIEEAHNLLGGARSVASGEPDPAGPVTDLIVSMLAELRAYGVGVAVVDQTPAAISPLVRKNTLIKLVHRPADGEDTAILVSDLNLPAHRTGELQRLRCGKAFLYHEQLYNPRLIAVEPVPEHAEDLHDRELRSLLRSSPWYQEHLARVLASDLEAILSLLRPILLAGAAGALSPSTGPVRVALDRIGGITHRITELGLDRRVAERIANLHRSRLAALVRTASGAIRDAAIGESARPAPSHDDDSSDGGDHD